MSAVRDANRQIYRESIANGAHHGMGSTVVALLITDETVSIAHVGDSRAYLLRDGQIQPLTEDHSLVAEQVRAGLLTPEGARQSELHNYITKALGPSPEVLPDITEISTQRNDIFILATDGLTGSVSESEIQAILMSFIRS